jgi:hypothetical protein
MLFTIPRDMDFVSWTGLVAFIVLLFPFLETWILYRGHDFGVSSVVRDAYTKYSDAEFGSRSSEKDISNVQRHVKLISIAGKKAGVSALSLTLYNEVKSGNNCLLVCDLRLLMLI